MCVALEMITSPYITIATVDKSNAKSTRRRTRLVSKESIANAFNSRKKIYSVILPPIKFSCFLQAKLIRAIIAQKEELDLMENVFDTLNERGFIAQCTDEAEVKNLLGSQKVTFYIGFDPTADSLHAGHFIALLAMAHMQRAGHRPICLVGGGTGTIGDPSGRSDLRKVMTDEVIHHNCERFKEQIARFIDFSDGKALMVNNGDWLRKLGYIDLLREVGAHFTVNRMLAAECYKQRWDKGLTFLEFNTWSCRLTTSTNSTAIMIVSCRWVATTSGQT